MDHYSTLGIAKNASPDEIKRAYRKLASQHHPDKGGDKSKFQDIQVAYDTLSNPDKRAQYDSPQPQFQQGGFPPGFDDIFGHMFGGGNNPFGDIFGQRRQQPQRNKTLNIQTSITLEDAFYGKNIMATLTLPSGREQIVDIKIPAGIQDGTTLRCNGLGDDSIPNIPRGDIHLSVHIQPHQVFQRRGDDLMCTLDINCIDAMIGKTMEVNTIDGRNLEVTIQPGTQPGQILAAHGYGMTNINNSNKGRLLLNINVTIPTNLTEQQKDSIKQLFP